MIQNTRYTLTNEEIDSFISLLTEKTGIIPRSSHRDGIKLYIENILKERKITASDYKTLIQNNNSAFSDFINESTVNETYFFREEKQFILLKDRVFPIWRTNFPNNEIKIWSAACSYGEEAYSLAYLAKMCGITPYVTASDINSRVLEHCRSGLFLGSSIRPVDGVSFTSNLEKFRHSDGRIEFPQEIKNCIHTQILNLASIAKSESSVLLPRNQNIIFIRNVFIYFDRELRAAILKTIADKCLAAGGLLFVSMSEIAQIDESIIPPSLEKVFDGNVFYFHKKEVM
ncbi:MAG: hypothetical protein K5873_12490 [Treponema sp.]|nr:hypothetical protein [Treponema sp.]